MKRVITVKEIGNHGRNKIDDFPDPYYRSFVGDKDTSCNAETYEISYIIGLGVKYLGNNSTFVFTKLVCRMLGIKSVWSE